MGDYAQGGVVFWVDPSGQHGKVISLYDMVGTPWSNVLLVVSGADHEENGAGNSIDILNQPGHQISAAKKCLQLSLNGFSDWYLPAKNEMSKVFLAKQQIEATALSLDGDAFSTQFYLTSTEFDASNPWYMTMIDGSFTNIGLKSVTVAVFRPVRSF